MDINKYLEMNWLKATETAGEFWTESWVETPDTSETLSISENKLKKTPSVLGWSLDEEVQLASLAKEHNYDWDIIAGYFPLRTAKDIENRWTKRLDLSVKKVPWTNEEDTILVGMIQKIGRNWKEIAKLLPGRLPCAVKNRYFGSINKPTHWSNCKIAKAGESQDEELLLDSLLDLSDGRSEDSGASNELKLKRDLYKELSLQKKKEKIGKLYNQMAKIETFLLTTKEVLKSYENNNTTINKSTT